MCEFAETATSMVNLMNEIVRNLNHHHQEIDPYINLCKQNVKILKRASKRASSTNSKISLISAIGKMTSFRILLETKKDANQSRRGRRINQSHRIRWTDIHSDFEGRIRTGCITNIKHLDPRNFLNDCKTMFTRRINNLRREFNFVKVWTTFCGEFCRANSSSDSEIREYKYINTKNKIIDMDDNLSGWYDVNIRDLILRELEEFQERDSGWSLCKIVNLMVNVNKHTPLIGSSFVELPQQIKNKRACINVRNQDQACFAWAVVSALYPVQHGQHPDRISSHPHYRNILNFTNISFPISRSDINKFELLNNISINIYFLRLKSKKYIVEPARLTRNKLERHVNILHIQNEYFDEDDEQDHPNHDVRSLSFHYVWIKNISALISDKTRYNGKLFVCDRCFHFFYKNEKLMQHAEECSKVNECKILFPEETMIKFKNFKNKQRAPFVIYADFECLLKKIQNVTTTSTHKYQQHSAYSVGYYVHCSYDEKLSNYNSYRGPDCVEWFRKELVRWGEKIETLLENKKRMNSLSNEEKNDYLKATICHICTKALGFKEKRVADHCHLTGKYRGAAHSTCNLDYQVTKTLPVIFHNLSSYDAHLLIGEVAKNIEGSTSILPSNTEKYISINKFLKNKTIKLQFIDSFKFMACSLAQLANNLDSLKVLPRQWENLTHIQLELLRRKGVFPYDYMDDWSRLDEMRLPLKEKFFSNLTMSDISEEEYLHAQNVWNNFDIKTMGEYSDLYMKTDVLLLADVFEEFRNTCLKYYDLDPAHYIPALSWDAMLKYTDIELDTIRDVDILMFVERGIRGGLTQCTKRYAKANNKYMADYTPDEPHSFLMYFDINGMYAWAMTQYLPHADIQWVEDVQNLNFHVSDENDVGYILEVDLTYPEGIHDRHADLPLAPLKSSPPHSRETKMLATLENKERYILHYRNLKQHISEGLILTKIHRAIQFKQKPWLKPYIDLNVELRKAARNEFERDTFKLINNAIFGKTMENVRLRRDIKLVTKWEGRYGGEAYMSKPNFHRYTVFDTADDFVAVEMLKTNIVMNKPIYIGMSILDISKTILYQFHYGYMKKIYNSRFNLCYTDTDSLIYQIYCEDVYKDMSENIQYFDTSGYSESNMYKIPLVNKKVLGVMKDENNGKIMLEFAGLRAKMYACKVQNGKTTKKAKGVKRNVVQQEINFSDYVDCLKDKSLKKTYVQNSITSRNHIIYNTSSTKIGLNGDDNKRFVLSDNINTLPWGHYSLMDAEGS